MKKNKTFERMADDDFNNKVEEQHEMNVDDAELLQQQADKKIRCEDLLLFWDKSEVEKLMAGDRSDVVKKLKPYKQGVKRTPDTAASSSTDQPAAKAKTKKERR